MSLITDFDEFAKGYYRIIRPDGRTTATKTPLTQIMTFML